MNLQDNNSRDVFFIGLAMANRGRHPYELAEICSSLFDRYKHGVIVFGESDQTDADIDHDGRKPLYLTQSLIKFNKVNILESPDPNIGMNALYSESLDLESFSWEQINKNDLKNRMGSSERYEHHRIVIKFSLSSELENLLQIKRVNVIGQHQTAFLHAVSRYKQARDAIQVLDNLYKTNKKDSLSFILRDQNTWLPGERTAERYLRKKFNLSFPTDILGTTYRPEYLEDDSGGLNRIGTFFMKSFLIGLIKKVFLSEAIETIGLPADQANDFSISVFSEVKGSLDHPVTYMVLKRK